MVSFGGLIGSQSSDQAPSPSEVYLKHSRCPRLSRREALLGGLMSACGVVGCARPIPFVSMNVELVFEVVTEAGERLVSSGIWRMDSRVVSSFPNPGRKIQERLVGEAIPVAIGDAQHIFAMLVWGGTGVASPTVSGLFAWDCGFALKDAYGRTFPTYGDTPEMREMQASAPTPFGVVPLDRLPAFASFSNPSDPLTGKLVNPSDIPTPSGQARIDSFKIRVVKSPPSSRILSFLPWLAHESVKQERDFASDELVHHPDYFLGR